MAEEIRNIVVNSNTLKDIITEVVKRLKDEYDTLNDSLEATKTKLDLLDTEVNERVVEELMKVINNADSDFDTLKEISDWIKSDTTGAAKMQSDILANANAIANKVDIGDYEVTKKFVSDVELNIDVVQPEFRAIAEAPEIDFNQITLLDVNSVVDDSEGVLTFDGEVEDRKLTLTGRIDGLVINNTITQPEFEASNAKIDRVRDANVVSTSNKVEFQLYHNIANDTLDLSGTFLTPIITNTITQPVYAIESIPQTISLQRTVDVNLGINHAVTKEKPIVRLSPST